MNIILRGEAQTLNRSKNEKHEGGLVKCYWLVSWLHQQKMRNLQLYTDPISHEVTIESNIFQHIQNDSSIIYASSSQIPALLNEASSWLTFLMKATENVSQETMPWSISSTKAVRVKDSRSPKLQDNTHTQKKNTHHSKLHSSRWLGTVFSGKAQMAWNITRNERSAETERERWQGARERCSMLRPGLLEEDRSTETGREKGEMGQRFVRCSADRLAFGRQRGAVRRPAGAGQHSAVFQSGSEKAT